MMAILASVRLIGSDRERGLGRFETAASPDRIPSVVLPLPEPMRRPRGQRRRLAARPSSSLHQQRRSHSTMTEFCALSRAESRSGKFLMGAWHGAAAAEAVVGPGRPTTRLRRDAKHQPVSVKELALGLSKRAWRAIEWREGTAEPLVLALCARAHSRRPSR